jgi:hypothetical protein
MINISAKNYSALSNISLLTGKVLPLIASWPSGQNVKNYFYNALHFVDNEAEYLQHTRLIFGI